MNKENIAKRLRLLSSGVLLDEAKHLMMRFPEAEIVKPGDEIFDNVELPYPNDEQMQLLDEAAILLSKQNLNTSLLPIEFVSKHLSNFIKL